MVQECLVFQSSISDHGKLYQTPCETTPYIQGPPVSLNFFYFSRGTRQCVQSSEALDLASGVQMGIE